MSDTSESIEPLVIDSVPREGMKLSCALMRSPAPLHWDDEEVRRQGLGDRAFNPGINNAAYVVQLVGRWAGGYERVRKVSIRFESRLFAEDRAIASGEFEPSPGQEDTTIKVRLERDLPEGREGVISGEVVVRTST